MNDHDACIILNILNGLGGISAWKNHGTYLKALIEACGSVSAVFEADAAFLSRIEGVDAEHADRICRWREFVELESELKTAKDHGAAILCRTDDEYPESLRELDNPPLCIYIQGELPAGPDLRSIAIVGTRTPSDHGSRMARIFAESAVRCGWATVSGLALGIDTAAHRATLDTAGRTVAVPGSGLANVYPPENIKLAREIVLAGGAVVSEYPMNTSATRCTLPRRNRIIAALSCCTLVVEAGKSSGALITAKEARKLGRRVFAVPGMDGNPLAEGTNDLIRQGEKAVIDFANILSEY